jgi:alkyl hydroperoxide reductase subunit AhpC
VVNVAERDTRLVQAKPDRIGRKTAEVLLAIEALLLSKRHDVSVFEQRRG